MNYDLITTIWFIPAVILLGFAIYNFLEGFSKPSHKILAVHHIKQAGFLFFCAILCLIIDNYFLKITLGSLIDNIQIKNVIRFLLFPALTYFLAKIHGGKKDEKIDIESIRKRRLNK